MTRDFLRRLFSGIPKTPDRGAENKRAELARCRFLVEDVRRREGGEVVLQGRMARGRLYVGEPVELIGFGETATVRCDEIFEGRERLEYASPRAHHVRFVVGLTHDEPGIFRAGQVLAAPATGENVVRCEATLEITGTPGKLENPLSSGTEVSVHFGAATVRARVTLPDGHNLALPGETATVRLDLSAALPLEAGDEIQLSFLGHVFAGGRVAGKRLAS